MFDMMDDPTALLRLSAMFPDSGMGVSGPPTPPPTPPLPVSDFGSSQNQPPPVNFTPNTTAQHHLSDVMSQMPQYQNPGLLKKLGAAIVGGGYGPQAGVSILEEPYNRDLAAWKQQVGVAENAARDENAMNQIGRQAAYNSAQIENNTRKQIETERENQAKDKARQTRADADAFAKNNPNWIKSFDDTGQIIFFNPKDPTQVHMTGITSGERTAQDYADVERDREKAAMARVQAEQAGATARNENTVKGAKDRVVVQGWGVIQDKDGNIIGRLNKDTGEYFPVTSVPAGGMPTSTANEVLKFEHTGANSPYAGKTVDAVTTSGSPNIAQRIFPSLFGTGITKKETITTTTPGTKGGPAKSNTVLMTGPDGKDYPVPADKVQDAIQNHQMKIKGGS